jgi:hypothetical protein
MDYAACNVVYVDRTAGEDKLVKRDDATSPGSTETPSNHAEEYASAHQSPSLVDDNLRTLLGTFSEGMLDYSILNFKLTNIPSLCLHIRQILCLETIRIKSSLNRRINTYPRSHRHPLRRSIA